MSKVFKTVLVKLTEEWNQSSYQPLLEADVAGWIFKCIMESDGVLRRGEELHLESRVLRLKRQFFDIAIGRIDNQGKGKPSVSARVVAEIKLFPKLGFSPQQLRRRFQQIMEDDLKKVGRLPSSVHEKAYIIVDGFGYLDKRVRGKRRGDIIGDARNAIAGEIKLFILRFENDEGWSVSEG